MVKKIKKEEQPHNLSTVPTKYLVTYCNRNKITIPTIVCFVVITDLNNNIN